MVDVPPQSVLRAGDDRMSPLFRRLVASNLESRTLTALRDTLLPKLMSGEIRVRDAERAIEAAM
jgi:type I restriction enzyme S subunit